MEEQNKETIVIQSESIELIKNSKGYNWKLKLLPEKGGIIDQIMLSRLDGINQIMIEKYGGGE